MVCGRVSRYDADQYICSKAEDLDRTKFGNARQLDWTVECGVFESIESVVKCNTYDLYYPQTKLEILDNLD